MTSLLLLTFFPAFLFAQAKVAFLEQKNRDGQILQLEIGGRFSHVALSYQGKWLHSHPFRGVEIISTAELEKMGEIKEILQLTDVQEPSSDQLKNFLGKPYDRNFSWEDNEHIDCSEMIGKILGLKPEPMTFAAPIWPASYQKMRGRLGLSPDDVYRKLKKKTQAKACAQSLR